VHGGLITHSHEFATPHLAGVMGGIAEYLGWSPTLTRILFVIISCASVAVPGILIYIILWFIMPNATPDSYR